MSMAFVFTEFMHPWVSDDLISLAYSNETGSSEDGWVHTCLAGKYPAWHTARRSHWWMFMIVTTAVNVTVVKIREEWWWERILSNASNNDNLSFFDSFLCPLIFFFSLPSAVCLLVYSFDDRYQQYDSCLFIKETESFVHWQKISDVGNQSISASTFCSIICLRVHPRSDRSRSKPNRFSWASSVQKKTTCHVCVDLLNNACPCLTDDDGIET